MALKSEAILLITEKIEVVTFGSLDIIMMISKLPNVTTSIFSVMSKMASDFNAINLSQGFPNFESDPLLIELVNKAMKDGFNQYAPMPGDIGLRATICEKVRLLHDRLYDIDKEITITAGVNIITSSSFFMRAANTVNIA